MNKPTLVFVFFLISLMGASNLVHAQSVEQAKFAGKTIVNPNRTDTATRAAGIDTKTLGSGSDYAMYDVWFNFTRDDDGDGYYHQFDINFDIDTRFSSASIYVVGQLNNGTGTPLFQTDPYTINGATGADSYNVTVLLTDGYPSAQYALTLNVYDAQTHALLLTYGPQQEYSLGQLYLEDVSREASFDSQLQLFQFNYTLSNDYDSDGYYTDGDVHLDVDAPNQTLTLYASLYIIDNYGNWIPLQNSSTFVVSGYSSHDGVDISFGLNSGFDPQNYRLGVEIYNAQTHNLLLTSTTPDATPVRMESVDYDDSAYGYDDYYYSAHAAGSLPLLMLAGLGMLAVMRTRVK